MIKLNLGCGFNQQSGYINVDKFKGCNPDVVVDLEKDQWPWDDSSVDEIRMHHVLEHLGQTPDIFLFIVKEAYRVLKPDGAWIITVPHCRHDDFFSDPTHVRAITPVTMEMFDLRKNHSWLESGFSTTPLAIMTGVDFVLRNVHMALDDVWINRIKEGQVTENDLQNMAWHNNNVIREINMVLHANKSTSI